MGKKAGKRKQCPMCGQTASPSDEHVFPEWLLTHLDAYGEVVTPAVMRWKGGSYNKRSAHVLGGLVNGHVCKDCNTGWMSRLESEAKPYLLDLMAGRLVERESLRVVAWWLAKTAVVINTCQNYSWLFTPEDCQSLREGLPDRFHVGLSTCDTDPNDRINWTQGSPVNLTVGPSDLMARLAERPKDIVTVQMRIENFVGTVTATQVGRIAAIEGDLREIAPRTPANLHVNALPKADRSMYNPRTVRLADR